MNPPRPTAFVTVFKALNDPEAQLVRGQLEVAAFHPVILNEYSAMVLLGGQAGATTGLVVQVPADEAEEAKAFLASPAAAAE